MKICFFSVSALLQTSLLVDVNTGSLQWEVNCNPKQYRCKKGGRHQCPLFFFFNLFFFFPLSKIYRFPDILLGDREKLVCLSPADHVISVLFTRRQVLLHPYCVKLRNLNLSQHQWLDQVFRTGFFSNWLLLFNISLSSGKKTSNFIKIKHVSQCNFQEFFLGLNFCFEM